jgi:hypothetical protein
VGGYRYSDHDHDVQPGVDTRLQADEILRMHMGDLCVDKAKRLIIRPHNSRRGGCVLVAEDDADPLIVKRRRTIRTSG